MSRWKPVDLAIVALMLFLAGCTPTAGVLDIVEREVERTASDELRIVVNVKNTDSHDTLEGTLFCEVTVDDRVYEESRQITLRSGRSSTYEMEYDVPFSDFEQDGKYQCGIRDMTTG